MSKPGSPTRAQAPTPPAKAQTLLTDFAAIQGALMILSNVLAAKIWGFSLGPLLVTFDAGLIIYPLTYVVGDLMIEIYGPRPANRLAWRCGALNLVAFVALLLADLLPAAPGIANLNFHQVLGLSGVVFLGSTAGFVASQLTNTAGFVASQLTNNRVFERIRQRFGEHRPLLRFLGSSAVAHAVDIVVFNAIAFAGRMSWTELALHTAYAYLAGMLVESLLYLLVTRHLRGYLARQLAWRHGASL